METGFEVEHCKYFLISAIRISINM